MFSRKTKIIEAMLQYLYSSLGTYSRHIFPHTLREHFSKNSLDVNVLSSARKVKNTHCESGEKRKERLRELHDQSTSARRQENPQPGNSDRGDSTSIFNENDQFQKCLNNSQRKINTLLGVLPNIPSTCSGKYNVATSSTEVGIKDDSDKRKLFRNYNEGSKISPLSLPYSDLLLSQECNLKNGSEFLLENSSNVKYLDETNSSTFDSTTDNKSSLISGTQEENSSSLRSPHYNKSVPLIKIINRSQKRPFCTSKHSSNFNNENIFKSMKFSRQDKGISGLRKGSTSRQSKGTTRPPDSQDVPVSKGRIIGELSPVQEKSAQDVSSVVEKPIIPKMKEIATEEEREAQKSNGKSISKLAATNISEIEEVPTEVKPPPIDGHLELVETKTDRNLQELERPTEMCHLKSQPKGEAPKPPGKRQAEGKKESGKKPAPASGIGGSKGRGGGGGGAAKAPAPSAAPATPPKKEKLSPEALAAESFMTGTSSTYIEEMHSAWLKDHKAVHKSWDVFFRKATEGVAPGKAYQSPFVATTVDAAQSTSTKQHVVQNIAHYYQMFGHLQAEVDPLGMRGPTIGSKFVKAADRVLPDNVKKLIDANKLKMEDSFAAPVSTNIAKPNETLTLQEIIKRFQNAYCGYIGIEYMHIPYEEKRQWIQQQFEPGIKQLNPEGKKKFLKWLTYSLTFEEFLSKKWPILFRFSLEGGEALIPLLHQIIDRGVAEGATHFVLGMAHRGRLNVLANILNKDLDKLFVHFRKDVDYKDHVGDVKYHLGCYVSQKHEKSNKDITICILSNPSHLESVNPTVQGRAKAELFKIGSKDGKKVVTIIIHGDAAYAGQGVVYEQNTMCYIPDYEVHGIIHIVINNNIGFTAVPEESRSSLYCSDVAKTVNAPVFHVNGEKCCDVAHCANVACSYRNKFGSDVVIDLVGYRQWGHNEADEPAYTSPHVYANIRKRKRFPNAYAEALIKEKVITQEEFKKEKDAYLQKCDEAFKKSEEITHIGPKDWNDSPLSITEDSSQEMKSTGVSKEVLKDIFIKSCNYPEGFEIHRVLNRVLKNREKLLETDNVDWAMAETIAYGSLLIQGNLVRLSGQDTQRGTFSHRHHIFHHQKKEDTYIPLNHLSDKQAKYQLVNSPLCEYGALGFEYGFASSLTNALVVFEAQYGDFLNNAQSLIDICICCGDAKWGRQCGLVMLLPHGLEGLGPEHSSARLERFLQLSGEDPNPGLQSEDSQNEFTQLKNCNWIVANCTTPANFFHIIRRQLAVPFRRPLIIMSPKSQLRHTMCRSKLDDLDEGTSFKAVLPDLGPASEDPPSVERLIFCSGKVYYDLFETRQKNEMDSSVAIIRVEQLTPFPFDKVLNEIQKYSSAEIFWVQEEHKNQGAWSYVLERFLGLQKAKGNPISYIGRPVSAVSAVATPNKHNIERMKFLEEAMTLQKND